MAPHVTQIEKSPTFGGLPPLLIGIVQFNLQWQLGHSSEMEFGFSMKKQRD
jgi:hypothetical protein